MTQDFELARIITDDRQPLGQSTLPQLSQQRPLGVCTRYLNEGAGREV